MKIISWNVNGLRAIVKKNFFEFIDEVKPDILGLQETKLQPDQVPEEILDLDYYQYWSSAKRKGYSGVALFTKQKPLKIEYSIGKQEFDDEGRVIIAEFEDYVVINCYYPNGQKDEQRLDYKLRFYDRMLEVFEEYTKNGKKLILCGDFNTAHHPIDLARPKANEKTSGFLPIERAWLDKIVSMGYIDTFRMFNQKPDEYSWWSYRMRAREKNVGWRIDYFFINEIAKPLVKNAFIMQDVMGSDHCPIGIEI